MTNKHIKFHNKFVGDVIDKKKKVTIRKGDPFVKVGEDVDLFTGRNNKFAEAIITAVECLPAKDIVNKQFEKHENYSGFMDFDEKMSEYYDEEIEPSTEFTIIYFELKNE